MIITIIIYLIIFGVLFPPILKYKHKGAMLAFLSMYFVSFTYSMLMALDVNLDSIPFFFSNILRNWGVKYPKL